jgi:SAM-dependent methyltransferase
VSGPAAGEPLAGAPDGAAGFDWNAAWQAARDRGVRRRSREVWDRRAPSFARNAEVTSYVGQVLAHIDPAPDWSVLDVGCGAGTLAVPLARRVRSVTALDFSPRMLELLGARCAAEGVANVVPVLGAWEDDWARLGIGTHDVAIASRSLSVDDLRGALVKLDAAARRRVHVAAPAGEGPIDGRVVAAAGRTHLPGPDYLYTYNLLHQLGIYATVAFAEVTDARRYATPEEAYEGLLWMVPEPTPEEAARLRAWLAQELVAGQDGLRLARPRTVRWAILSWSKGEGGRA